MKLVTRIKNKFYRKVASNAQVFGKKKTWELDDEQAHKSLQKVKTKRKLTEEQKKEIIDFYQRLMGVKVSVEDHEYFYSRTGIYTKDYMPRALYRTEVLGRANRMDCYEAFSDKNLDEMLLPDAKHPRSIVKNVNGYFYHERRPISREEALDICRNIPEAIIKPSLSQEGKGVKKISVKEGVTSVDGMTIEQLFDKYDRDFIIQEAVHQHPRISALNPTSVNTMRIMTYRSGMEVLLVYGAIRIGRQGQVIDNQSAGGISVKINNDGTLGKYGFGTAGDDLLEKTDSGITLEGYQLPSYDKAVETVKRLHYDLPLFDIVGWDIAINEEGEPVLIEWNGRPGPSQTACGTGFGNLTERILTEIRHRPNTMTYMYK